MFGVVTNNMKEFDLVEKKELAPMQELIDRLCAKDGVRDQADAAAGGEVASAAVSAEP